MKRYKLIGSYTSEEVSASINDTHNEIIIPLMQKGKFSVFGMDHVISLLEAEKIYPSEIAFDLVALALLVYTADTRISRELHAQDSWTREIFIDLPVSNPGLWEGQQQTIERMLKFLTGDIWIIRFLPRDIVFSQTEKEKSGEYESISLFSGGMDSLISTINQMEIGHNTLLAAHAAEGLVKKSQTDIISKLNEHYPEIKHTLIDLWTSIPKDIITEGGEDNTTRSRSFLFVSFAVFIASGTGNLKKLIIPENGLIAINVPMDSMRVGSHSTRTTHPFYLKLWNEILNDLGFDFEVENPYWNKTKGEMAAECLNKDVLYELIPYSMSCSSPGKIRYKGAPPQHCGYCLPCLIRRAAMNRAYRQDPTTYYEKQVGPLICDRDQERGVQIRSLQFAAQRVKDDPKFAKYAIFKPGPLEMDDAYLTELADTYYRGLMEVDKWIQDNLEKENAD